MSITVTTPTGNIGSALTALLLERGEEVTIIARDRGKVAHFEAKGARVVEGSHIDDDIVIDATRNADALFVLVPPDMGSTDIRAHYRRFGEAAAQAIRKNNIPFVVHLSSVGAELEQGAGPVIGLHDTESILADAATNIVQLRPGYFMENTLWQIGGIKGAGQMYNTINGETPIPMIATRDIAKRAADLLINRDWKGQQVVELQGASDISYKQVAAILSDTLGTAVAHVTVTPEQSKQAFVGMGASPHIADLFNEMGVGIDTRKVTFHEPRSAANSTPTTYQAFAEEVFKPAYDGS